MVDRLQVARTSTNNTPPADGTLRPGELFVELGTPPRLWVGVPASISPSLKKLLLDTTTFLTIENTDARYLMLTGGAISGNLNVVGDLTKGGTAVALAGHTHPISDVTDLQTTLDGKASLVHGHVPGDISGLGSLALKSVVALNSADTSGILPLTKGGTGADTAAGARTALGLGSAATKDVGTSALNLVQLDAAGKLPGVDGSQLTNLPQQTIPSAFPSGTKMLFKQTAAPTGWTKDTSANDAAIRVVSGSAGSGGSVAFSTAFANKTVSGFTSSAAVSGTIGATALTASQMPPHQHYIAANVSSDWRTDVPNSGNYIAYQSLGGSNNFNYQFGGTGTGASIGLTSSSGGGAGHSHSFSGGEHSHSFSGSVDLRVSYIDVIVATKD